MRSVVFGLFLALELGGGFGVATATVDEIDSNAMIIEITVEVTSSTSAVVAHLAFDDDPQIALPLLDRGGGLFGITTQLPSKNYAVVFESVGGDGSLSPAALLSDLGADFGTVEVPVPTTVPGEDEGLSSDTKRLGWLALALGAASLSVLAFWVILGRDRQGGDDSEEE